VPADRLDAMRAQAEGYGQAELTRAAEIISAGLVEMRGATSPRLLLELMAAQVLLPAASDRESDLRVRLERLERRLESAGPAAAGTARPATQAAAPAAPAAPDAPSRPRPAPSDAAPSRPAEPAQAPRPAAAEAPAVTPPAAPAAVASPAAAEPDQAGTGLADAGQLRDRWPDVLEAVRRERKVAWILLTNATVESLADGILTVEFAREGDAKGFTMSGHDRLLSDVLQQMFGISPQVRATARPPGGGQGGTRGSGGPGAPGGAGGSGAASGGRTTDRPGTASRRGSAAPGGQGAASGAAGTVAGTAATRAGAANGAAPAGSGAGRPGAPPGTDARAAASGPAAGSHQPGGGWSEVPPPEPPADWDDAPADWDDPRDDEDSDALGPPGSAVPQVSRSGHAAAPAGRSGLAQDRAARPVSGMDLIERELGARIIEGLEGIGPA
jgi:DNA polymerase-3 subunit gamma/tau